MAPGTSATGLTVRTFHHYNDIGLLQPSRRTDGRHRIYSSDDVARLAMIVILRRAGLSLSEIKDQLDTGWCRHHRHDRQRAGDLEAVRCFQHPEW